MKQYMKHAWDPAEILFLQRVWFEEKKKDPKNYRPRVTDMLNKQFGKNKNIHAVLRQVRKLKEEGTFKYVPPKI